MTTPQRSDTTIQVLSVDDACPEVPMVEVNGRAIAVVWPGTGARDRSMHLVELAGGGRTRTASHDHEAVYYVMRGAGAVRGAGEGEAADDEQPIGEGSMVHMGPGSSYQFVAGPQGMTLLGGPCPFDPALYTHLTGALGMGN